MEALNTSALMPQYRVLETRSVEESRQTLYGDICPHRLTCLNAGSLNMFHSRLSFRSSALHHVGYGVPVRVDKAHLSDSYLVLIPCRGESALHFGGTQYEIAESQGAVIAPGSRFAVEGAAGAELLLWRIRAPAVTMVAARLFQGQGDPARRSTSPLPLSDGPGAGFLRALGFVLHELQHGDGLGANPVLNDRMEEMLIAALLGATAKDSGGPDASTAAPACVRRVEAYMATHAGDELSMDDLVTVSGVSARTLFRAFRHFRGRSPMTHLRLVRQNRVREDLLNAAPDETVTSILTRWGISQFGRFAADYRRRYGELPSETLRAGCGGDSLGGLQ